MSDEDDSSDYGDGSIEFLETPVNQLVVKPLLPSQVRWFYYKSDKKFWKPMSGYDSLNLESAFEALSKDDTKPPGPVAVRAGLYEVDVQQRHCKPVYWQCKSDETTVRRGLWFSSFGSSCLPLEERLANEIENEHLKQFRNIRISAFSVVENKKVIHSLRTEDKNTRVDWFNITDVKLVEEKGFFKQKFGMGKGQSIYRGYHAEACKEEGVWNINELCFVVHGIGQKMQEGAIIKTTKTLSRNARKYTKKDVKSQMQFLPVDWRSSLHLDKDVIDSITPHQLRGVRDTLNGTAMDIMYYNSPIYRAQIKTGLRDELNRLYSMFCERNPAFGAGRGSVSIIAHSLGSVIAYDLLVGHESGNQSSDQQINKEASQNNEDCKSRENFQKMKSQLKFPVQNFFIMGSPLPVFLTLRGIRPQPSGTIDHILPRSLCARFFNIYHPADPVAYRIEPLILRHYATFESVVIQPYSSYYDCSNYETAKRQPIKDKYKLGTMKYNNQMKEMSKDTKSFKSGGLTVSQSDPKLSEKIAWEIKNGSPVNSVSYNMPDVLSPIPDPEIDDSPSLTAAEMQAISTFESSTGCSLPLPVENINADRIETMLEKTVISTMKQEARCQSPADPFEQVELESRVDFQVKEKSYVTILSALTAHFSYWKDDDVVRFIVDQIFHSLEEKTE